MNFLEKENILLLEELDNMVGVSKEDIDKITAFAEKRRSKSN